RPEHHEGEARIPVPREVEEAHDLGGLGHAREREPHPEEEAGAEPDHGFDAAAAHDAPPSTWWTTKTVAMPVVMKVAVATIDRLESRPMPHTPWPLVQPLPRRVPKPTRSPAAASSAIEGEKLPAEKDPGERACIARPPSTSPPTNAPRQCSSPATGLISPPKMPLMPATRPSPKSKSAAPSPRIIPPSVD